MEKIKQAMQLAREARETSLSNNQYTSPESDLREDQDKPFSSRIVETLDTNQHSEFETEKSITYTNTKVIDVPKWVLQRNKVVAALPSTRETVHFKLLRTQVLQSMKQKQLKSLSIVSSSPGEGKTLTAINLAYSIALEAQHTVILVDLDLKNPSICKYFDYEPELGITDYLFNKTPIDEILFTPGNEGLVVLPGRETIEHSSELLSSKRLINLVKELTSRYRNRIVLFDLPPLLSGDDVLAFAPYSDAALLVIEDTKVKQRDVQQSLELLKGTHLLGTVLNKSSTVKRKDICY